MNRALVLGVLITIPACAATTATPTPAPTGAIESAVTGITDKAEFIDGLYTCILERIADAGGFATYDALPPSTTLASLFADFFESTEYVDKNTSNTEYVTQLYQCILYRAPDPNGLQTYVDLLATETRAQILSIFVTSTEFLTQDAPQLNSATGFAVSSVGNLNQSDPMTWLVKTVCTDANDNPLPDDPYNGCPDSMIRKLRVGESLPYYNKDDFDSQWNNYPIAAADGTQYVANIRQFGTDHVFRSQDQFDVYRVDPGGDGWVSVSNTRDGGGYNTTFFGPSCEVGNGWRSFPASNFLAGGSTTLTIAGDYWQQSGQAFPGTCTSVATTDAITTWSLVSPFEFGGENGGPVRPMDAIVSVHGYEPSTNFQQHGHIETFYYTREYGITRWEVWTPTQQNPTKDTVSCANLPDTISYQGETFVVTDCHDNSDTTAASSQLVPVWPVPNVNMIAHANFDNGGGYLPSSDTTQYLWHRGGDSPAGNIINWSLLYSSSARDTAYGTPGVRYLATNCGAGANGECGFDESPPVYQEIYEELPISAFTSGQSYGYGVSARAESGSGTLMVGIQQLDNAGHVLWGSSFETTVGVDNGSTPSAAEAASVFLASAFAHQVVTMPIQSGATKVRFFFSPLTPQTFDILEAWLAPWGQ